MQIYKYIFNISKVSNEIRQQKCIIKKETPRVEGVSFD